MSKNLNFDAIRTARRTDNSRELSIVYALLRGHTMDRVESPNSNPHIFPNTARIISLVEMYYHSTDDGVGEQANAVTLNAFCDRVSAALAAWRKQLYLNWLERTHRRGESRRPATLASRVA